MDFKQKVEKVLISFFSRNSLCIKSLGYKICQEDSKIRVYRRTIFGEKIIASFGDSIIVYSSVKKNHIYYYPDIHCKIKKRIKFNEKNFPGLISGSMIDQCMLIPYIRDIGSGKLTKAVRIVIITDKCQVYHNNPSRKLDCEGESIYNDDIRFEESAVWDMPGRKYPTLNDKPDSCERYYPFLPDSAYEYHPCLNTDNGFKDKYGNGGFGKTSIVIVNGEKIKVCRFYFPKRNIMSNSFHHIGGEESDYKMTLIGTYRPNNNGNGARTVLFATTDGGRNWYAKYEFGDMGTYEFTQGSADWRTGFGNPILPRSETSLDGQFYLKQRTIIPPSGNNKEPVEYFCWSPEFKITNFKKNKHTLVLSTNIPHNLQTGSVVAIIGPETNALCNNSISPNSGGNGILYKVKAINEFDLELFEYIHSTENPICCRHIHQINRIKDGWLIGTGEVYPNGWLLYFQMKDADTYSTKYAWEEFDILRLNSTAESVQRTLGALLLDDKDQTLIFASDHDTLSRSSISVPPQRSMSITRSSTGIYMGKLKDIDDRDKFQLIYEAKEPSFLFKEINNNWIFAGQRGELAISLDRGKSWIAYKIDTQTYDYHGSIQSMAIIGDYVIEIK